MRTFVAWVLSLKAFHARTEVIRRWIEHQSALQMAAEVVRELHYKSASGILSCDCENQVPALCSYASETSASQ